VDDEMAAALELEDQVLAPPAKISDDLPFERRRDQLRRLGPRQPRIVSTSGSSGTALQPSLEERP
jgi:hypothetical protein